MRHDRRAQADFLTDGAYERGDGLDRRAIGRIDGDRRASRIVAVETLTEVQEKLRAPPGPEDESERRAGDGMPRAAGVGREVAVDAEAEVVETHSELAAQPVRPPEALREVSGVARLHNIVLAHGRDAFARSRAIEPDGRD